MHEKDNIEEIAIIGMAGRFPGAQNTFEFWQNLHDGVESIQHFTDEELIKRGVSPERLAQPNFVKAGTIFDEADMFDADFFGYNHREAEIMDPQQRVFLEIASEALESAGYSPEAYNGSIGIFAGTSGNDYRKRIAANQKSITSGLDSLELMMGNDADFLTTRVSYKLNLKGPSLTIQTACSTSLVAVHQASQSLLTYQCDMALAGGICIRFPQGHGYLFQEGMIWSPDGHCRPFDSQAQGTLFGHGAGIVVLKRLSEAMEDGDTICAIIKASAINNDGAMKVGFTAPGVDGQAEVISTSLALADVTADEISYVEAHGTGTPLGDPIEVEALCQVFKSQTDKRNFCALGSVKSNIGHLDTAAGVAGLIKTVLALQHKKIPATLHFQKANPAIDLTSSPFIVNNTLMDWQHGPQPRRAGVSSFGIGGTNAHVILEETPAQTNSPSAQTWQILPLSARTKTALQTMAGNLVGHLTNQSQCNLVDVAHTLQTGRRAFQHRGFVVSDSNDRAITMLKDLATEGHPGPGEMNQARDVAFMFSGQGSQHIDMALGLYQTIPFFKEQVNLCAELLQPHLDFDLRAILFPSRAEEKRAKEQINQTRYTQPALFTIEYAMAKLWMHWGITPAAMVGHSIGEYVAACLAGVFTLADALRLVAIRGRLMQSLPSGSMLSVSLTPHKVERFLTQNISVAVINGASRCVVSGPTKNIKVLEEQLLREEIDCQLLRTSHAFHSTMMEPILDEFTTLVHQVPRQPPQIPFVSNTSGSWITEEEACDPYYWARHLRQTVDFFSCTKTLLETPLRIMLEIGPGQTLQFLSGQHPDKQEGHIFLASSRRPVERKDDMQVILNTLGTLWQAGITINWPNLHLPEKRRRIPLPTYPFERQRYWLQDETQKPANTADPEQFSRQSGVSEGVTKSQKTVTPTTETAEHTQLEFELLLSNVWQELLPGKRTIKPDDNFFELGGDSLQAVQMFAIIEKETGINLPMATLLDTPTFSGIVDKFAQKGESKTEATRNTQKRNTKRETTDPWACLVPIQPEGNRPPFFCVHGVGSNTLNYRVFVSPLGMHQPLYGLQAKGLDGISEPLRSIEEMASHYIQEIRRIQPTGPYYLGGASFGGTVALEMAQQLQQQGEEIAFLVLFDTQGPTKLIKQNFQRRTNRQKTIYYLKSLLNTPLNQWSSKLSGKFSYYSHNIRCQLCRVQKKTIPHHLRYVYLERINLAAWYRYQEKYYNGKITLFRAKDTNDKTYSPAHGWQGMATDLKIIEIPGKHSTFIEQPEVGRQLSRCLVNLTVA